MTLTDHDKGEFLLSQPGSCFTRELGVGERRYLPRDEVLTEFPNRFDPHEALDRIQRVIGNSRPTHTSRGDGALILDDEFYALRQDFHALRAYITGMERAGKSL